MFNSKKSRFVNSDSALNIKELYLDGVQLSLDDWKQSILLDYKPAAVPGSVQYVLLPSEIGLPAPAFFTSYPYTGNALFEEYNSSYYLATGWSVSAGVAGAGPVHRILNTGNFIISPLSGRIYTRPLDDPNQKNTVANFTINSGQYFNSAQIPETVVSGNSIIGWDIYYSLSGIEDLSVTLHGRYSDIYQENISDGVVMSSGDSAVSFFLEYGAVTGSGILEYYSASEFIATRWGVYAYEPGTSPLSINPFSPQYPFSGRFYYRDPKDTNKTTIANFSLNSGSIANWSGIQDFYIPFRKIIGIDLYYGLNDLKNVHIILGGKGIASANYYKNLITSDIFEIFSGNINQKLSGFVQGSSGDYQSFVSSIVNSNNLFSGFVTGQLNGFSGYITGTLNGFSGYITGAVDSQNDFMSGFSGKLDSDYLYLSGYLTGLVSAGVAGVTMLNGSYGAININGLSGIKVSNSGYPIQDISIEYTSGNFTSINTETLNISKNIDLEGNVDGTIPHKEGRIYYSSDTKTFNAFIDNPDVTLNIGEEQYVRVFNNSNGTINNGDVVYISGAQGNRPRAWKAIATNDFHTSHLLGIATHNILNNEEGLVTTFGSVGGINTTNFNAGDILYLSNVNAGKLINVPPTFGKKIKVAYALNSTNNGKIIVIRPVEDIENYTTIRNLTILRYI